MFGHSAFGEVPFGESRSPAIHQISIAFLASAAIAVTENRVAAGVFLEMGQASLSVSINRVTAGVVALMGSTALSTAGTLSHSKYLSLISSPAKKRIYSVELSVRAIS